MSRSDETFAAYAGLLANPTSAPWWNVVVITASSERQAAGYRAEIQARLETGRLPGRTQYVVVPDIAGKRMGSGAATIHALGIITRGSPDSLVSWWSRTRVLILHSGGDSRRLPQYSRSGKLFAALPTRTPWGDSSTVFDEMLALSAAWAAGMPNGLLVGSGDVILRFDASQVNWTRPGVTAVAMRQPLEVGSQHGVYAVDAEARVYTTLQKPSAQEARAAGALLDGDLVALDTGLLRFAPEVAARLTEAGDVPEFPPLDLYQHVTQALTGQWDPAREEGAFYSLVGGTLRGVGFHCDLVEGEFIHIGTTRHYRAIAAAGGGIIDSVIPSDARIGPESVLVECDLRVPLRVGRGSVVHGLTGFATPIDIPDDVVVHQIPISSTWGVPTVAIRTYGVEDNPKAAPGDITWFGRPVENVFEDLGISADAVWAGVPEAGRSLWNAALFPVAPLGRAWDCARWMLGYASDYRAADWLKADRVSLESSIQRSDQKALAEQHVRRAESLWCRTAVRLAEDGTDSRPLIASPPSAAAAAQAGRDLVASAARTAEDTQFFYGGPHPLTAAASRYIHAANFLERAGLAREAAEANRKGFACVADAVRLGIPETAAPPAEREWHHDSVTASAPARIDLGGGWSDTPPFCFDWGGVVLNVALELNGRCPVETTVRRLAEPVLRFRSGETGVATEIQTRDELLLPTAPGDPTGIFRIALQMSGIPGTDHDLRRHLEKRGGGLEIVSRVSLPVGSGLGTSSILAATVLRALWEMTDSAQSEQALLDQVMELEQSMTTGGGWQDQAGGILPGAKLLSTGPGLRQRIRFSPVAWTPERRTEFEERLVLYYTGIRRIARNLLQQVVRSYLGREVATVQVLHSIKTLASEMAWAITEGDWPYLGELLNRHWELNKVLDPNTTNAPINAILRSVRPHIAGAKLAGAGGGGFLILLAKSPDAAALLRTQLGEGVCAFRIADEGIRVTRGGD